MNIDEYWKESDCAAGVNDQRIWQRKACQLKTNIEIELSNALVTQHHLDNIVVLEKRMNCLRLVCMDEQSATIQ